LLLELDGNGLLDKTLRRIIESGKSLAVRQRPEKEPNGQNLMISI
jgi:hypothetical protein